jgi:hypothetical protein
MTIGLTRRRTTRKIKRLKENVSTISPDYSDCATPDFLVHSREKDRSTVPRPFSIFIGGFVRKDSVDAKVIELSLRILVITADPDVSDASTFAGHETAFCVRKV